MNILELSSRNSNGGRRRIKIALLEIPNELSATNLNGLHWVEQYVQDNIESLKGMGIFAQFSDSEKRVPWGHGATDLHSVIEGKSEPTFLDSECVGTIEYGKVEDVEIKGVMKRVLVGYGYVYIQRYPNFVQWLKDSLALGIVDTSIEIMGTDENDRQIVYDDQYEFTQEYRVPKIFTFSGVAVLGNDVKPSDSNAIVIECESANNKEEENKMNEKEMRELIQNTIVETNSKNDELNGKIAELNQTISEKDATIAELNEKIATLEADKASADAKVVESDEKVNSMTTELNELKADKAKVEMEKAISKYSDEEKKYAEVEINEYNADPLNKSVDAIVNKINAGIVDKAKADEAQRIAEINSANDDIDIFGIMENPKSEKDGEVDIFA